MCKQTKSSRSWSPAQWTSSSVCIMVNGWWHNCCRECSAVPGWYHNDDGPKAQNATAVENTINTHGVSHSQWSNPPPIETRPPPPVEPRLQPSWFPPSILCSTQKAQDKPLQPPREPWPQLSEAEPPPSLEPRLHLSWTPPPISCRDVRKQQSPWSVPVTWKTSRCR